MIKELDSRPAFSISEIREFVKAAQSVVDHAPASCGSLTSHIWELNKSIAALNEAIKLARHRIAVEYFKEQKKDEKC